MKYARNPSERLARGRHLLLTAFDRDGKPLRTSAWVVADGSGLGIVALAGSPVAECVRHRPGVLIGPCDYHGRPKGEQLQARAILCDQATTVRYRMSLLNKYGLIAAVDLARRRLRYGLSGTIGIRLTRAGEDWPLIGPDWRPSPYYNPN